MVLLNKGDEVLIPDPYFVMYKHLINLLEGKTVFYNLYPDFKIKEEEVENKITKKTKIIIINSPANPTGYVFSKKEIQTIYNIAKRNNLFIISDEIYSDYVYDEKFTSILEFTNNALLLGGFSKNFSITGWRVGFALGPSEIIKKMITLQQYTFVCSPAPFQYAVAENLNFNLKPIIKEYKLKRDTIYNALKNKFEIIKPKGAFYIFPKVPNKNATEFVEKAIKNNVLIIPGNVFSEQNTHFRISFAADIDTLKKGAEILCSLV